jgi:hypothetical protein
MITYRDIDAQDYGWLYYMLANRPEYVNISHAKLPSYTDHCEYWDSTTAKWETQIILADGERVGYYYITDNFEIGIFVDQSQRNKGIEAQVLGHIKAESPGVLFANISPRNPISKRMFKAAGFKKIQETYKWQSPQSAE